MRSRVLNILKNKSGASLIIVLAVTMLLMAIGVSALAAAGANAGFMLTQKEHSQIKLLDDSVHKNILYSLQHDPSDAGLLSRQLAYAIYEANDPYLSGYTPPGSIANMPVDISLNNGADGIDLDDIDISITLSFADMYVNVTPGAPEILPTDEILDDDGNVLVPYDPGRPREPKTAVIMGAKMEVIVIINANGKISTSRSICEYAGGRLDDGISEGEMDFETGGYGEWRLVRHEKIDSTN